MFMVLTGLMVFTIGFLLIFWKRFAPHPASLMEPDSGTDEEGERKALIN
jgi:hypothetical protein